MLSNNGLAIDVAILVALGGNSSNFGVYPVQNEDEGQSFWFLGIIFTPAIKM